MQRPRNGLLQEGNPFMKITRLNHVGLNAADCPDEVRDFYFGFLGLRDIPREGAANFVNGFWSGQGHPIIHMVTDTAEGALAMPNGSHVSLFVEDIDVAVAAVKARTEDVLHIGEGRAQIIWFKDPAGNTLELQQDPDMN